MNSRLTLRLTPADMARFCLIRDHLAGRVSFLDRTAVIRFALSIAEQHVLSLTSEASHD
ncbi:hypothetical protein [Labrenzia sp. VG12]|uniref:hypothetical protein n=1 Tax=Labrenzia sp. VG12 TaxID=2021862 RepID=UPI0012FE6D55|nr:hypothetical protein [Labrenzia sp. VG12]